MADNFRKEITRQRIDRRVSRFDDVITECMSNMRYVTPNCIINAGIRNRSRKVIVSATVEPVYYLMRVMPKHGAPMLGKTGIISCGYESLESASYLDGSNDYEAEICANSLLYEICDSADKNKCDDWEIYKKFSSSDDITALYVPNVPVFDNMDNTVGLIDIVTVRPPKVDNDDEIAARFRHALKVCAANDVGNVIVGEWYPYRSGLADVYNKVVKEFAHNFSTIVFSFSSSASKNEFESALEYD